MKLLTICPDGADVHIDVSLWRVQESIFIPTLVPKVAVKQLREKLREDGDTLQGCWTLAYKVAYHDGKYGVRVWRTK